MFLRQISLVLMAFSLLWLTGCPSPVKVPPTATPKPMVGVNAPWATLAANLAQDGLDPDKLRAFFNRSDLVFTSLPMATKLRELFTIFYRADLTKEVQEKLYQLGYDILIDGRNGSGTQQTIKLFQKEKRLAQTGVLSDALNAQLDLALRTGRVRTLQAYQPPPPQVPVQGRTYQRLTTPQALRQIKNYYLADRAIFDKMESRYHVPGAVVAAIMWVETSYGNFFGNYKAAEILASMAASSDYNLVAAAVRDLEVDQTARDYLTQTSVQRGHWAYEEIKALLINAWENGADPLNMPGSIFGAVGYGQFMPTNLDKYVVDANGDKKRDIFNKEDAIFSIGNFLRDNGWSGEMTLGKQRLAIRNYNNSAVYINTVLFIMEYLLK
ncbi:MAG: lytic murein transglycosylase [Deltaproteobacteria bacterium]|jgi:membrane-bound lytic murein transglycosylase B|nr:lytic murein transglycosylase [Deltaproteobacteria bacterium]